MPEAKMTIHDLERGQPVELHFAGRDVQGVIEDIRWTPSFNAPREEIVVDADGTMISTGRTNIR